MFKFIRILFLPALLISFGAAADDDDEKRDKDSPIYSSFRLSQVETDFDNLDSAISLGGSLGINIPGIGFLPNNVLAVEIDTDFTIIPGENSGQGPVFGDGGGNGGEPCAITDLECQLTGGGDGGGGGGGSGANNTTTNDEFQMFSLGIFAAVRTPTTIFGTARYGTRYWNVSIPELDDKRSSDAWSLGLGYRYGEDGLIELLFSDYGSDVTFLTLNVIY